MGTMRILDRSGDTAVAWSPDDTEAVARAAALFDRLADQRLLAFARQGQAVAEEAERVYAFDPHAEEIIWVRPIAGG